MPFGRHSLLRGRDGELKALGEVLAKQHRQAVTGPAGVGKTQLAVEYAYRHREEYHGVHWSSGGTTDELIAGWSQLAGHLALPLIEDVALLRDAVKYWLESHPESWLIVIDSVEKPESLIPFLPKTGASHVLLTGLDRTLDALGIYTPLRLEELLAADAVGFLLSRTRRLGVSGAELDAATSLAERDLGGFPLALEQAAAYIVKTRCSFADYRKGFQSRRLNLLELGKPANYQRSLVNAISATMRQVSEIPASADLARFIAVLDEDALPRQFLLAAAAEYGKIAGSPFASFSVDADALRVDELLAPLFDYSLIREEELSREYRMHNLIRLTIRDITSRPIRSLMEEIAVNVCGTQVADIDFLSHTQPALRSPHGLASAKLALSRDIKSVEAGRLLRRVGQRLLIAGDRESATEMLARAKEIFEKTQGSSSPDLAALLLTLAIGDHEGAGAASLYRQVISMADPASQESLKAVAQNNLAEILRPDRHFAEAERLLKESLKLRQKLVGDEDPAVATALNNFGNLYGEMGLAGDANKFKLAESFYARSFAMRKRLLRAPDPHLANSLNNLGWIYMQLGWRKKAEQPLRDALAMWEELYGPEHPEVMKTLSNLIKLYNSTHRAAEAKKLTARIEQANPNQPLSNRPS